MLGLVSTSANKIAARYRARGAAAGVSLGRGGAGAGRIGAQLGPVGLDVAQVVRIVENQGVGAPVRGRVASRVVASPAVCQQFQGLGPAGRLIASYRTGPRARVPAAAGRDRARAAGGGVAPRGGPARQLTPGCARRRSPANRAASPALAGLQAFGPRKNREAFAAAHGVGGSRPPQGAGHAPVKRLNRRAKSRPGCCKSGRGETSPVRLRWGKARSVCGGRNRVN